MKIIHCADIHADSKMRTHFDRDQAAMRRNEIVDTFESMVEYAIANEVKVIIIAGDMFDGKKDYQKTIKKRIKFIIEQAKSIDFLYLRGNHDGDFDFDDEDILPNLKGFNKESWIRYVYEDVVITGREFGKEITDRSYSELNLESDFVNIVVMHGQIVEYMAKTGAPEIALPKLSNKYIDYLALGHIHSYKKDVLDRRGHWAYSGCLEGRGFDEFGEKGFVLLSIRDKKINTEFIPFAKRQMYEVFVNLENLPSNENVFRDVMISIEDEIQKIETKNIVQIILTGEIDENIDLTIGAYEAALKDKFFYVRVKDKTQIKIDYKKYENDVSLKGEFIRLVKNDDSVSEDKKKKIIVTGIKALAGRL